MKLFLVGNGFDIENGIPSKYTNFRNYLISLLDIDVDEYFDNIFLDFEEDLSVNDVSEEDSIRFILKCLDNIFYDYETNKIKWGNFEEDLPCISFDDISVLFHESDDDDSFREIYTNEDMIEPYLGAIYYMLPSLFEDWVVSVQEYGTIFQKIRGSRGSGFNEITDRKDVNFRLKNSRKIVSAFAK